MPLPNDISLLDENKPDGSVIVVAQLDDFQREHRQYFKGWATIEHAEDGRHKFAVGPTGSRPTIPPPAVGTIFINTDTGALEYWNGAAWVSAASPIPFGTVMLFRQSTAPTGWTRQIDVGNTDSLIRVVVNGEVPGVGGNWTISGLTVPLGTHAHEAPVENYSTVVGGGVEQINDPAFPTSGITRTFRKLSVTSDLGAVSRVTVNTATSDLGAPGVASTGAWRPKYIDVIIASKN